jgi:hypothetical protein
LQQSASCRTAVSVLGPCRPRSADWRRRESGDGRVDCIEVDRRHRANTTDGSRAGLAHRSAGTSIATGVGVPDTSASSAPGSARRGRMSE